MTNYLVSFAIYFMGMVNKMKCKKVAAKNLSGAPYEKEKAIILPEILYDYTAN